MEDWSQMKADIQGKFPPYVEALHLQLVFPADVDSWQGLPHVRKETADQRACQSICEHVSR